MMLSEKLPSSLTASQQALAAQGDAESINAGHRGLSVALSGGLSFADVGALTDILQQAGPSQLLASIGPNGASKLRCSVRCSVCRARGMRRSATSNRLMR
ncbi:hypothetical protein GR294_06840 [Raoultella sp. Lac2]|uniref:hypothetical protein n=1 Tax=unclassified Raoultella TaxID=2627600 RepID=UPI00135426CD|nr:hypothetical protein [Raoultella sp. Lac2]MXF99422.1 hypothetical protein [Raoultella sp. Lac1]